MGLATTAHHVRLTAAAGTSSPGHERWRYVPEQSMMTTQTIELPSSLVAVLEDAVHTAERRGGGRWFRGPGRAYLDQRADAARAALATGTCISVQVRHDSAPAVLTHEHGLLVVFPVDATSTQLLEILSVADDPRWDLYTAGGLMRAEWSWLRVPDLGSYEFAASGAPIDHVELGDVHGTQLEVVLTEGDDGWPGDDATLPMPFDDVVRLAGS